MESNKPFVSVVVPIYKVEQYLRRCIDSLINQTYSNYEVILVDDGSPDKCGDICEEYATLHEKIRCFHKENGGLSDARNYGVTHARGEYIIFVDSDDYVSKDHIEYLVGLLYEYDADLAIAGFLPVKENTEFSEIESLKNNFAEERVCMTTEEAMIRMLYVKGYGVSAWSKIYPKELVLKYPYPRGRIYEDLATTYKIIGECKKVAYGGNPIYFYLQRSDSIMHQKIDEKHLAGFTAANEQLQYMEKNYPNAINAAHCRYARKVFEFMPRVVYSQYKKENQKIFIRLREELKPHYRYVISDRNVWNAAKVRYTGIMLGYYPAIFTWKLIDRLKGLVSNK